MKTCRMCGEEKPLEEFTKSRGTRDGRYSYCKPCKAEYLRNHRRENPEYWRKWYRGYAAKNREKLREQARVRYAADRQGGARSRLAHRLRADFGMTLEDYDALVAQPCGLCGATENIVLDHCHETGKVRGPLCGGCNTALGLFRDDTELLLAAVEYLERK